MKKLKAKSYNLKAKRGFVALISAIIISVVLLLIVTNASLTGFYSRSNISDGELKEISSNYAEACVDTALLKITNDSTYSGGGDTLDVDTDGINDCVIESVTTDTIYTKGNYNNKYYTNLKIGYDSSDVSVTSWEEISNYP